ncbi:unnamed protein product [Rhizoctonia solani]|nr:unnamed protein product [Rhizoctonia solani]
MDCPVRQVSLDGRGFQETPPMALLHTPAATLLLMAPIYARQAPIFPTISNSLMRFISSATTPRLPPSITLAAYVSNTTWPFLIRDMYASIALVSFFLLLLECIAGPRLPEAFNQTEPDRATVIHHRFQHLLMHPDSHTLKWIFPLGWIRARPRDGLTYLHWMTWGVLQYCIVRPGSTLVSVLYSVEHTLRYRPRSFSNNGIYTANRVGVGAGATFMYVSPRRLTITHEMQVVTVVSVSTTVAMYCLVQLYSTLHHELKPYKPGLKLLTTQSVLFLTFWQSTLLSGLASLNLVPDTEYLTAYEIITGFTALLETFEMMCLAVLHVWAFSYRPYERMGRARTRGGDSPLLHDMARVQEVSDSQVQVQASQIPNPDLPASPTRQLVSLFQTFTFHGAFFVLKRPTHAPTDEPLGPPERSFMRTRGYKGLPQDEGGFGLRSSPFPTLEYDDDPPPPAGLLQSAVPRVEYVGYAPLAKGSYVPAPRAYVPAPPPKGAYVPAHGPAWSGDGVITPPRTPVVTGAVSPSHVYSPHLPNTPAQVPSPSSVHPPTVSFAHPPTLPSAHPQTVAPQPQAASTSRRIRDVYVGGTRGEAFVLPVERPETSLVLPRSPVSPRTGGTPVSPRSGGMPISPRLGGGPVPPRLGGAPVSPRSGGMPISPRSGGTPISARSVGYASPLSTGPFAPRSEGAQSGPTSPLPKGSPSTHISPTSAQMLAQTSPLFQQSFSPDVHAGYPLSPVSPPLLSVSEEAPPRTSAETLRTQRNSGFTLPHWATGTPTHFQWPSGTTHSQWPSDTTHSQWPSSRRTSAYTVDPPPSPTRGRPMSVSEEVEPPSSSRDDSLLVRVFSDASRARDSESGEARTSILSVRTGECVSSSNGSDEGAVHPVRSVSFRSGMPVMVRLGERRDSISSPSLVSSSFGGMRESYPSTPSSASPSPYTTLPSPPEVARPLRRMNANLQQRVPQGPRTQPRTVVPSTPLSPARYPHSTWRTVNRSSGLGHVSSVHGTVSHWSPIRPPSTSSLEGRTPTRSAPDYTATSSLSSLSNSDDRPRFQD